MDELHDFGCNWTEIAELILEDNTDTPWIYFTPQALNPMEARLDFHISGYAHKQGNQKLASKTSVIALGLGRIPRVIEELCGLAGIAPPSRDRSDWKGNVAFESNNSIALVSYKCSESDDLSSDKFLLYHLDAVLQSLWSALGYAQEYGICCDSFTILRRPSPSRLVSDTKDTSSPRVALCWITFDLVEELRHALQQLKWNGDLTRLRKAARRILSGLFNSDFGENARTGRY
jgi:hypothetical protein